MRFILAFILTVCYLSCFSQNFQPIPEKLKTLYQFNFQKNFFKTERDYESAFSNLTTELGSIENTLKKKQLSAAQWVNTISKYGAAESGYRVIDLYLFLRYVVNTKDEKADRDGDSLRNIIRHTRTLIKQYIYSLPESMVQSVIKTSPSLSYFIQSIRRDRIHLLNSEKEKILQPFRYLTNASFYNKAVSEIVFEKVKTEDGEIDVRKQMSSWENNADQRIRNEGRTNLFKGYASKREVIGYKYIEFIKGLNVFAKAKNFSGIIDEKFFSYRLPESSVENIFSKIIEASNQRAVEKNAAEQMQSTPLRYTIPDASKTIINALREFGPEYSKEISDLLNPHEGRIDIGGGENRFPIRGTASVYPIYPSVFYALNYEGYLMDMIMLAHESGHAVQASLMTENKVSLLYSTGPGYFTESFGKFNEVLLFDYLSTHETDTVKRAFYKFKLKERLEVLFGSAEEAFIEYSLIKGITSGKINSPDDLDSLTKLSGTSISPLVYKTEPERKGLWLLLETNYHDPLHNLNDMIGAALAIAYYKMYKENKSQFVPAYIKLLKEGYYDTPGNLLKKINIDIQNTKFIEDVLSFLGHDGYDK